MADFQRPVRQPQEDRLVENQQRQPGQQRHLRARAYPDQDPGGGAEQLQQPRMQRKPSRSHQQDGQGVEHQVNQQRHGGGGGGNAAAHHQHRAGRLAARG